MKKKGNKKMPTPRHKLIHNPIPTSLFLSSPQCISCSQFNVKMFFLCLMHSQQTNKIQNRDVGMGLWMSLCLGVGIFLFPFFFMHWHPYIPLHFIEMIFPLSHSEIFSCMQNIRFGTNFDSMMSLWWSYDGKILQYSAWCTGVSL